MPSRDFRRVHDTYAPQSGESAGNRRLVPRFPENSWAPDLPRADGAPRPGNTENSGSALGELERAAGLGAPVFLALDHPRVAGEKAVALEHGPQVRLVIHQRLGDAVAHRSRLAGEPAARDRADDIVLALAIGRDQRLLDQHAQHRPGEEDLHRLLVHGDAAGAGLDPDPGDRVLALAGGIGAAAAVELLHIFRRFRRGGFERGKLIERLYGFGQGHALLVFLRFMAAISSACGCCAAWG